MTARKFADRIWRTDGIEDISEFMVSLKSAVSMMEQYSDIVLKEAGVKEKCDHNLRPTKDKRYPYNPIRCAKCGYEP
jgi:hydrogenase maturation factor HypF (carbamoyltransferase family)